MDQATINQYQTFAREQLGFEFKQPELLITALTHRSYVNEHKKQHLEHNERLEYLGDAVLELVVTDFLYRNFKEPEGTLTSWRSALVRTESIGAAGEELGYSSLVRLSKGEQNGSDRAKAVILADCFEAVVGATYLDQGYETAKSIIEKHILTRFDEIIKQETWRDPKSHLQELTQKVDGSTPVYRTLKDEGPDHNKTFTVGVYVGNHLMGTGVGHSKQEAQGNAALEAIKRYRH
ncbi:ribonuclease III [Candidatus Saccharibacteria bacterium]|nr:ribonuclease III [Candidatus Saccharibacteria bacterium]